jgi:glycosyltransferase involved in cell wall biosynthesis
MCRFAVHTREESDMSSATLAAVLVVSNEAEMLERCLRLLSFADELVIVVDAASRDETEAIARRYSEKTYVRPLSTFADQKNFAMAQAASDWILLVDADERVTPALAAEIRSVLSAPEHDVYRIPLCNYFLGRRMRHGGWLEVPARLMRRAGAMYEGNVHERLVHRGTTGRLSQTLWHFSHRSIVEQVRKTALYGPLQAMEWKDAGRPKVRMRTLLSRPGREIYRRLIREKGWADGFVGYVEALFQGCAVFCTYVALWELQQEPSITTRYEMLEAEAATFDPTRSGC